MDEITQKLNKSCVSGTVLDKNNSHTLYKFCELYKQQTNGNDQEQRRKLLLAEQKTRRANAIDSKRFNNDTVPIQKNRQKFEPPDKYSKNRLMLSEWLIGKASDMDINWLYLLCPKGRRSILVTYQGCTFSYDKYGILKKKFSSLLPDGSFRTKNGGITILDCIWVPECKQFYILDLIQWNHRDWTDYSTEFRFFWLKSKIIELPELATEIKHNDYPIQLLDSYLYNADKLSDILTSTCDKFPSANQYQPQIDGILFYHKECSYEVGFTPLVGWLKVFMLPEILNIPNNNVQLPQIYLNEKPREYTNLEDFITKSKQKSRNWWTVGAATYHKMDQD